MLDLRKLHHFGVLAERLNYVRAAEVLGITQPTLSRSIQALERQLGARLFDRDRGGVALTPQGRLVAERARSMLAEADDLESHMRRYGSAQSGRIRFGMAPMPARALLTQALADRLEHSPSVTNEVVVRDVESLWAMLNAGDIEFFISPERPLRDLTAVRAEVLGIFPLSVIVRHDHPLLQEPNAGQFPLIRSSWTGTAIPPEIQSRVLGNPNVIEDSGTLAALAMRTNALWMSSVYAIHDEIAAGGLVELLRASQHIEITLYCLRRRTLSPLAEILVAAFRERAEALLELCGD
jgi:DNA-binding transcriptional LysR family regulator